MDQLIKGFPNQLEESIEIGQTSELSKARNTIHNIVVSGLGGSGIGADLVQALIARELKLPFIVNKGYFLPSFVNENSLVIISSYSGNTEETVNVLNQAIEKNAKICCVTSNGAILETAKSRQIDFIQIPGGNPPRACLGYSFLQQLYILKYHGCITSDFETDTLNAIELLRNEEQAIKENAKQLASKLFGKIPVIYSADDIEVVAVRYRQQINENGKMLSWHHVLPEMNHNELVGWRNDYHNVAVIFLRNTNDFERIKQRMELTKDVVTTYAASVHEIYSIGESRMEQMMYLIHLGDWLSFYLSKDQDRDIDPVEVKVIDHLKGSLSKLAW